MVPIQPSLPDTLLSTIRDRQTGVALVTALSAYQGLNESSS